MICDPANPMGSEKVNVWQEDFLVRFGSVDNSDRLTLDAVFNFFQEAAISHAENLGVGREAMANSGNVWVLSRLSVIVERRPKYLETVNVRSWPCGGEKLFAMRNYEIRDKDNIAVASGRSAWLIVDMEKHRPIRPQTVIETLPSNEGLEAMPKEANGAAALAVRDNLQKVMERKALYTDVDYNSHVNNVKYAEWIEDALAPQLLETAGKMRIDINYVSEILAGETVEILSAPIDDALYTNAFALEGRKIDTGQAAFRAELRLM